MELAACTGIAASLGPVVQSSRYLGALQSLSRGIENAAVEENYKGLRDCSSPMVLWNLVGLGCGHGDDRGSPPFRDRSSRRRDDRLSDVVVVKAHSQCWTDGLELSWQAC
jgi:hypothetical protein